MAKLETNMRIRERRLSRQAAIIKGDARPYAVTIIGVGGIGSNACHLMVSMGFEDIHVFDPDHVEEENIFPAYYSRGHVGSYKAVALREHINTHYGITPRGFSSRFGDNHEEIRPADIVLIATDDLFSRQQIWEFASMFACRRWWIDARMGATLATVITVDMNNKLAVAEYEEELATALPGDLPCGEKATAPQTKGFINGMLGQSLYDILNDNTPPYKMRYDLATRLLLIQDEAKGVRNPQ